MFAVTNLCDACRHRREITSAKGSRFLLCLKAESDRRYPKYPPQPLARCTGFEPAACTPLGGTPAAG